MASEDGRGLYARRKAVVELVNGQIKQARGFRRFSFRGLEAVEAEWALVCACHNLLKLFANRPQQGCRAPKRRAPHACALGLQRVPPTRRRARLRFARRALRAMGS